MSDIENPELTFDLPTPNHVTPLTTRLDTQSRKSMPMIFAKGLLRRGLARGCHTAVPAPVTGRLSEAGVRAGDKRFGIFVVLCARCGNGRAYSRAGGVVGAG